MENSKVMDVYYCKKDLETYGRKDLDDMAKYYDVSANNKNDLCWLLAINNMKSSKKAKMFKGMYKPTRTTRGAGAGGLLNATKYNQSDDECRWPTRMGGFAKTVKDCNFNMKPLRKFRFGDREFEIAVIPAGTDLYHGTKDKDMNPTGPDEWYENNRKKMVWFASTLDHTMPLGPMKIFKTTNKEDLTVVFFRNKGMLNIDISKDLRPMVAKIAQKLYQETDGKVFIDGYMGCNECEIGIFLPSLSKLVYPVSEEKVPYIE